MHQKDWDRIQRLEEIYSVASCVPEAVCDDGQFVNGVLKDLAVLTVRYGVLFSVGGLELSDAEYAEWMRLKEARQDPTLAYAVRWRRMSHDDALRVSVVCGPPLAGGVLLGQDGGVVRRCRRAGAV